MPRSVADLVLPRVLARRRWSSADARAVLKQVDDSGLSVREFAARHGVDAQRLHRWRRAQSGGRVATTTPTFVEITPRASAPLEVVLRSGRVVRVPSDFSEETLRRLLAVLDGAVGPC